MDKKDKKYIKSLKEYNKSAEEKAKYSIERFDILIISISSGGLALSTNLYDKFKNIDYNLVNIAWIFFSTALIVNLLSQGTGYKANKLDIKCTKTIIDEVKGKKKAGTHKRTDSHKSIYNFLTGLFNVISFLSLLTAIILIIIFINSK